MGNGSVGPGCTTAGLWGETGGAHAGWEKGRGGGLEKTGGIPVRETDGAWQGCACPEGVSDGTGALLNIRSIASRRLAVVRNVAQEGERDLGRGGGNFALDAGRGRS